MKKRLLTILITSLIMIGAGGGFLWKMSQISRTLAKNQKALLTEERDLNTSDKALKDVDELKVVDLYLSGQKKNVITKEYKNANAVYNTQNSASAEEMLTDIKKKVDYTTEKPLWAYNPYGTNNNSLYLYFKTQGKCYCRYTITVEDKKIPDFTRTLSNGASGNVSKEHEYQIIGLVPGYTNYIVLKLYNNKDELAQTLYYRIDMPGSQTGAQVMLSSEEGLSKVAIQNGLYTVLQAPVTNKKTVTKTVTKKVKQKGKKVKKKVKKNVTVTEKKSAILVYDNSGVLRAELPTVDDSARNAQMIYDNLVYFYSSNGLAQVNSLGQVVGVKKLPEGYSQAGEFAYDGYGSIYTVGYIRRVSSQRSPGLLRIQLESGEVSNPLGMKENLTGFLPEKVWKGKDIFSGGWSIQVVGNNQLLIGIPAISSIMKVSNVNGLIPKLDYIIADKDLWQDYGKKFRKKVLEKALPEGATEPPVETPLVDSIFGTEIEQPELFESQYGQNAMVIEKNSSLAEGQYYLYMLNNNEGKGAAKGNKTSYYDRYLVDETAGTYILEDRQGLEKNAQGGNVTPFKESFLYCKSDSNTYLECDAKGKLIKSFRTKEKLYRVYKEDWKGFWFY